MRYARYRCGRLRGSALVALLLAASVGLGPAVAQAGDGALVMTFENDSYTGFDGGYSSGLGITYATGEIGTYDPESRIRKWVSAWSFLPFVGDDGYRTYASVTLSQEIHTPSDITDPNPPLDDQPYAGILYADAVFHARKDRWGHTWNVRAGLVGPAVHAAEAQKWVHDLINSDTPQGWHTQLPNEPLLNVSYSLAHLWRTGHAGDDATWRLVPSGSVSFGNFFTGVSLGLYGEIGWDLADTLGLPTLRNGFGAVNTFGAGPVADWSVSFFVGAQASAVAHYLPLDGTMFRDSRSVDSEPMVGLFTAGVAIRHRAMVFTLAHSRLTETFDAERDATQYGTFNLSWYF